MRMLPSPSAVQRWTSVFTIFLVSAMLLVGLSACDSTDSNDDPGDMPPETASVTVGESNLELNAFFAAGEDPETGVELFIIYLTESDETDFERESRGFIARFGSQPGAGTYAFGNFDIEEDDIEDDRLEDEFVFEFREVEDGEEFPTSIILSNGGELTINTSTDSEVTGSFEVDATEFPFLEGDQTDVSVEGTFNAGRIDLTL